MQQFPLDTYVVDTLLPDLVGHDRQPSAFVVYLLLYARIVGMERKSVRLSHQMLADGTGLSRSAVQAAVRSLVRRKLVDVKRTSPTSVPEYTLRRPWRDRRPR